MENLKISTGADFKETISEVMFEINKRKLATKFYKKFDYSASIVSLWKNGKRLPTGTQQNAFIKVAIDLIKEHDLYKESIIKEKNELLKTFTSLVSA